MSTYDIQYDQPDGHAKRGKAIQDIINYLGPKSFAEVSAILVHGFRSGEFDRHDHPVFRMALLGVGVQGYPCRAWFQLLFGAPLKDEPGEVSEPQAEAEPEPKKRAKRGTYNRR